MKKTPNNSNKKSKVYKINSEQIVSNSLTANDYLKILNDYSVEYSSLKDFNLQKTKSQLINNNLNTINSDLSNLNLNLISKAKLDNSKPFKVIESILNYEKSISNSDKEIVTTIKQLACNKFNNTGNTEIKQPILKCLMDYSKKDISNSYIIKTFDLCNKALFTQSSQDKANCQITDKNKSSYQNILADKLKGFSLDNDNCINNKDIWKSIVYIANKITKSNLRPNFSFDNDDINTIKTENFDKIFESTIYSKFLHKKLIKSLKSTIFSDKALFNSINHKLKNIVPNDSLEKDSKLDLENLVSSLINIICNEKEEDFEKAIKKCDKIKKLGSVYRAKLLKNVKPILVKIRIAYLITAYNKNFTENINEEYFWKSFMDNYKEISNKKVSSGRKK